MLIALSIAAGLILLFFALIGAPHLFRGTPVDRVTDLDGAAAQCDVNAPEFRAVADLALRAGLREGNTIELLENGDGTFPRLWQDLRDARRSITIVSYFDKPGAVVEALAAILIERVRNGVPVYWTYDAVGSGEVPEAWFDRLRQAGARVAPFRPIRWYKLDRANNRTHVRSVVIDGAIGYTGGFGLDDLWQGDGCKPDCWRDSNVRITGPAVGALQSAFIAHWGEAANELLVDTRLSPCSSDDRADSPESQETSATDVRLAGIVVSPTGSGSTNAERMLALSVGTASRQLFITNAYVVPDAEFVDMLCAARARGVDVRILTNGEKCDVPMTRFAGRRRYDKLLRAGVRIYEYQPTVLHSKTLVSDGLLCAVGTINFDNRSLALNSEISALVLDEAFARRMEQSFHEDLGHARELDLDAFRRRPLRERAREFISDFAWRWL